MHVLIFMPARLPAFRYGGAERVAVWLGRGLVALGHRVTYLAAPGSHLDFAQVLPYDRSQPLDAQIPRDVDIVHLQSPVWPRDVPACQTWHGNTREAATLPPNTIFVSENQARRHNGRVFVHNGLDGADYVTPDLDAARSRLTFLANAAWRVKNVTGAIRTARQAGLPIDILGGRRINFSMGFRLTLDPNACFFGMVDNVAKAKAFNMSRGLVFPVRWDEPFGIALIEAMYFGAPAFGTPYGALPELVPDFAGHLATSAEELAEAIVSRRFDPRAIHAHACEHFSHLRMARDYVALYERILAGETLHPGPISSPPTRARQMLPWQN